MGKVTGKRSREGHKKSTKYSRKIVRHFENEPTEKQFNEITQKITKRISEFNSKKQDFYLFNDLVHLCEDLQTLADRKSQWNEAIITWCLEVIEITQSNKTNQENEENEEKEEKTINQNIIER